MCVTITAFGVCVNDTFIRPNINFPIEKIVMSCYSSRDYHHHCDWWMSLVSVSQRYKTDINTSICR